MPGVELQFLGSGDAFGTGGRLQTCMLLRGGAEPLLIDCGASSLIATKRAGVDPSDIGTVVLSHLHGDHFGGIPFLVLDGQFSRRERPLVIAGPPGVGARVEAAMEVMFPGSSTVTRRFDVQYVELAERIPTAIGPATATAFAVEHASGATPNALSIEYCGKTVAYSGDTEWTPALLDAARGADVFVCEAYSFEKKIKFHLDLASLREHAAELECRRIILTHMGPEMLAHIDGIEWERAEDGKTITL